MGTKDQDVGSWVMGWWLNLSVDNNVIYIYIIYINIKREKVKIKIEFN